MNRNPFIPFLVIMVLGIGLMFLLSFKGLSDAKEMAKETEHDGKTEEIADGPSSPEELYKQSCIGCHGDAYQGDVGPALTGVGDRLSAEEIREIIVHGKKPAMPSGLVTEGQADDMVKFLQTIK